RDAVSRARGGGRRPQGSGLLDALLRPLFAEAPACELCAARRPGPAPGAGSFHAAGADPWRPPPVGASPVDRQLHGPSCRDLGRGRPALPGPGAARRLSPRRGRRCQAGGLEAPLTRTYAGCTITVARCPPSTSSSRLTGGPTRSRLRSRPFLLRRAAISTFT